MVLGHFDTVNRNTEPRTAGSSRFSPFYYAVHFVNICSNGLHDRGPLVYTCQSYAKGNVKLVLVTLRHQTRHARLKAKAIVHWSYDT
eukprot:6214570-Pleurochrysis_carterae.AAC.8